LDALKEVVFGRSDLVMVSGKRKNWNSMKEDLKNLSLIEDLKKDIFACKEDNIIESFYFHNKKTIENKVELVKFTDIQPHVHLENEVKIVKNCNLNGLLETRIEIGDNTKIEMGSYLDFHTRINGSICYLTEKSDNVKKGRKSRIIRLLA